MKYEYDYELVNLSDEQKHLIEVGLVRVEEINPLIREIINQKAKDGWEPLYPFSMPAIWFRKQIRSTRATKK